MEPQRVKNSRGVDHSDKTPINIKYILNSGRSSGMWGIILHGLDCASPRTITYFYPGGNFPAIVLLTRSCTNQNPPSGTHVCPFIRFCGHCRLWKRDWKNPGFKVVELLFWIVLRVDGVRSRSLLLGDFATDMVGCEVLAEYFCFTSLNWPVQERSHTPDGNKQYTWCKELMGQGHPCINVGENVGAHIIMTFKTGTNKRL